MLESENDNAENETPEQLGKYKLGQELGRGAFATVYLAYDTVLRRQVALKVLHPALMGDAEFVRLFQIDARSAASLDHPHIITIHDLGQLEGRLFIDLKYMPGGSLADRLRRTGPLSMADAARIVQQIAAALDYAHGRGLIHRDVKPANILFDAMGNAVLGDFGVVKAAEKSVVATKTAGGMVGTPQYMAPEVWEGAKVSPATDIYALGCVLYDMLTGTMLFEGTSIPAIMTAHFRPRRFPEEWPAGIPPQVQEVLACAVQVKTDERFESAGAFASALRALQKGPTPASEAKTEMLPPWSEDLYEEIARDEPVDELAAAYAALQEAMAIEAWAKAVKIAERILAQDGGYRDVAELAGQVREKLQSEKIGDGSRGSLPRRLPRRMLFIAGGGAILVLVLMLALATSFMNRRAEGRAASTTQALLQATASVQARETATAEVQAQAASTVRAQERATSTVRAQERATSTALAQERASATALARAAISGTATARAQEREQATTTARNEMEAVLRSYLNRAPLEGPYDGELVHEDDGRIELFMPDVTMRDFVVAVIFENPYSSDVAAWNYGFLFRYTDATAQYRLILSSDAGLRLHRHDGQAQAADMDVFEIPGEARFRTHAGGENEVLLAVSGDEGYVLINGVYAAKLDLSDRIVSGNVAIGSGFFTDSEVEGESTAYSDFRFFEWEP